MFASAQELRDAAACSQTRESAAKATRVSRRIAIWLASAIALDSIFTSGARADLRVIERTPTEITVFLSGTITQGDALVFEALSPELERGNLQVRLDSTGGDVDAAMRIGRLVRKYEGMTLIAKEQELADNANCYSSCALIFIAGVSRIIMSSGGQLGLHRPYFATTPQSRQILEKQVPLMLSQVKQYIAEMGITDNFYQQMVNTEPSQMVVYGEPNTELAALNRDLDIRTIFNNWTRLVPRDDPVYQEIGTSYAARKYGVTTSEMRKRESDAEACSKIPKGVDWFTCQEAIRWGLSERVYLERDKQAQALCWHDEDAKFLQTILKKERRDHPVWIKRETCTRNVMLDHS